jgi:hypothetical protein
LAAIGVGQPHLPWWMDADPASDSCSHEDGQCGKEKGGCGDNCDALPEAESNMDKSAD